VWGKPFYFQIVETKKNSWISLMISIWRISLKEMERIIFGFFCTKSENNL